MSEYERGYRDAREAAAQICRSVRVGLERHRTRRLAQPDEHTATVCDRLAERIAALAPRIAAPDGEALVEMLLTALSQSVGWEEGDGEGAVRDIIAALREAGALRDV